MDRTWDGIYAQNNLSSDISISARASYWGAKPTATAAVNRSAIQAAIDYVSGLGGGVVYVDIPGYYNIAKRTTAPMDRALNVPKGVSIKGLGTGAPQDSSVALVTLQPSEDMTFFIAGDTMMSQTCTISNASPGVISATAHGKSIGDVVYFATSSALPSPLLPMFPYYILASGFTANSFQIGLTGSTAAINTTTAGSGTHTLISASSLTHSFGMADMNVYGGTVANVQCLIAESTVGAEWDNVLVEPGNPALQRHGWLHASNFLAAWLNQYTRLQVGGFTSGVGAAHYGSDSSYSQCLFSGSAVNFRFSEGSISIDGGQCENGNNGGGIGTGRGYELVPSNTGRNTATTIRSRFVANAIDIYIYDSPTGSGFNGRILIDSVHHDARTTNISVGVNFNNVSIDGTFNEMNPAGNPHITWRGASTGNVVMGNFNEGPATRFSGLPADALVVSGGNGQLNRVDGYAAVPIADITALRAVVWRAGRPTVVQVISNWNTGDGGGTFRWDAASTATDNGGTIIKETATATGRWVRQIADRINVTWFGAIGDGVTNCDAAFDAAAVVALATGRPFYMPAGSYVRTTTTTFSVASKPSDESEISYSIIGDGSGVTEILWSGGSSAAPFLLQGGTGAAVHHEATIKGFKVNSVAGLSGYGLRIDNLSKAQFEDFFAFEMNIGVYATDILSCSFRSCSFVFGSIGLQAERADFSYPNAISFYSCIFANNRQWALQISGGSSINLFGGSIEGNGISGTSDRGGVYLYGNPTQEGGCAFAAYGTYWEAQDGLADLFVDPGAEMFTIKIDGCGFNRTSSTVFTTNHIFISQAVGEGTVNLVVDGTAFKSFGTYSPSSSRKVIAATSLASVNIQAPLTRNIFENTVEMPDVLDTQPLASVVFNGTTGAVFRANPTGLTVTRLSAGEYRFNLPITTNTASKFVQLLSDTSVVDIIKWAETANTVTIRCYNSAGTQTDLSTSACAQIFNG